MDENDSLLMNIRSSVAEIKSEQKEFKRETLRRLDNLEERAGTYGKERSVYCIALITTIIGIVNCIVQFVPSWR